jgi:hypothetical protein
MPTLEAIAQPRLNLEFLETHPELTSDRVRKNLPERVLQFGEGGFLRGFVDWMIHGMNQQGLFNGRVVVIQPIAEGQIDALNRQTGAFTHLMRGLEGGKIVERREVITSISRGINPYTNFDEYLRCAQNPDLRFIVSNTPKQASPTTGSTGLRMRPPLRSRQSSPACYSSGTRSSMEISPGASSFFPANSSTGTETVCRRRS